MKALKVGIIGCGSIAQHRHLPEYAFNKHVELAAVCYINKERAAKVAEKYGVKGYTSYEELLKSGEVEAVSVCTPNYLHSPISIDAFQIN
ncbi:Gfo/Idh/MocA family oxidoreductase [Bacillus sp. ISL-40]|nr:Gfo/Idh/MocA family oxidoreductase [Bacillus sp. ISL-40]MBT2740185.1 Gfo/Idh/MocA family oxidoreductase [Bacillus sp. ISL-77]